MTRYLKHSSALEGSGWRLEIFTEMSSMPQNKFHFFRLLCTYVHSALRRSEKADCLCKFTNMNAMVSQLELELMLQSTSLVYNCRLQQLMLWICLPSSTTPAEDQRK